ncbi:uncharacterized protein [Triticum aestivum]|nr:uncharacterized protein LOC123180687 [Triticum aestivum]
MARASAGIGAPDARPEEDSCFIPSSFDMDRDMLEWEQTAAIAWAINAPRRLVALDVDRAIRKQFRLSHGDVAVTPYHLVEFLVKFEHKAQCDAALAAGRVRAAGAIVHIRPWRPLERAFGAALNYRVHLCLENVPDYAWTPYVAERIIGRRCSLDRLDDHSALRTNSETLDLWAWTADPNLIPKVIWLTFTTRPSGGLKVFANVARPSGCKRGATFRVLVHLDMVEDHSNATLDCYTSDGRAEVFSPPRLPLEWHMECVDGVPPPLGATLALPDVGGSSRAAAPRRRDRGTDDHPRQMPRRRDDSDDYDDDWRGGGGRDGRGRVPRSNDSALDGRRERTRSPRRRDVDSVRHGRRRAGSPVGAASPVMAMEVDPVACGKLHLLSDCGATAGPRLPLVDHARLLRSELSAAIDTALAPLRSEFSAMRRRLAGLAERVEGAFVKLGSTAGGPASPSLLAGAAVGVVEAGSAVAALPTLSACFAGLALSPDVRSLDTPGVEAWSAPYSPPTGDASPLARPVDAGRAMCDARGDPVGLLVAAPLSAALVIRPEPVAVHSVIAAGSGPAEILVAASPPPTVVIEPGADATDPIGALTLPADACPEPVVIVAPADATDVPPIGNPLESFLAGEPPAPLLSTPATRRGKGGVPVAPARRSARLDKKKAKAPPGVATEAVQELIAKVCGVLDPSVGYDDKAKQAYLDLFNTPLAAPVVQAIAGLVAHAKDITQKKA